MFHPGIDYTTCRAQVFLLWFCNYEMVAELVAQAAPRARIRDIYLADIGPDVPDATVENFVNAVNTAFSSR